MTFAKDKYILNVVDIVQSCIIGLNGSFSFLHSIINHKISAVKNICDPFVSKFKWKLDLEALIATTLLIEY